MAVLRSRPLLAAGLLCGLVAALTLLLADEPTYDPTAWLIWGRQISEGTLETVAGPSWKPLPVFVTAPSALLGDIAPPLIWLWVARTGGLMALVLAGMVAWRLSPSRTAVVGAVVAVAALVLANGIAAGTARGNSEGLLIALVLAAVLAWLRGRPRAALLLGVGAALLRPEAWIPLAVYSLWLLREDRRAGRSPLPTLLLLGGCGALVLLSWFVPEKIGSGDFLRGASRAQEPVEGSPAESAFPFGAVFTNSAAALAYPVYAGAVAAVVDAVRRRRWPVLAIAAIATAWMFAVAALAQNGFTGNLRYVSLPAGLLCVLGGIGWALVLRRSPRRLVALLVVAALPGVVVAARTFGGQAATIATDERLYSALRPVIDRLGGPAAVRACGAVWTGPFQTQAVAWELHLRQQQVGLRPDGSPGTVIARIVNPITRDDRYEERVRTSRWVARQRCR